MKRILLGKTWIGDKARPYVIAEIGVNHEGSMETAKQLIEQAHRGGAHAAKFQSYKAEKIAAKNSPSYWDTTKETTTSQFQLFKKYDGFGAKEYIELAEHCKKLGIEFVSTPFDLEAVDFLNPLMSFFKIASADLTNIPLVRKIAAQNKPILISVGASRLGEVDQALRTLTDAGAREIVLLHCILNYPTLDQNAHLSMIETLAKKYPDHLIGYSDHTLPDPAMVSLNVACLLGSCVLEKHFTHNKTLPGNDHYHAMDEQDLKNFWAYYDKTQLLLGSSEKKPIKTEEISRKNARRSLVTNRAVKKGETLSPDVLICKRPGTGISPLYWDRLKNVKFAKDLGEDHIITWQDVTGDLQPVDRIVAVVQARMGSQRFPQKMLTPLADKPILQWVLERLKKSKRLHKIVLATSTQPENDPLALLAKKLDIEVYRGSEDDVLERFYEAGSLAGATIVVRVCADNPFIDPVEVDRLVDYFLKTRPDYAFNHVPRLGNQYADGFGAEIFPIELLEEMNHHAEKPAYREHVTSYVWDNTHMFTIGSFPAPAELAKPELKFDIDTPADLQRLESVAKQVGINGSGADFIRASR